MQNNLMEIKERGLEDSEIDMYKLINIFFKNIKLFGIVTFLGILITGIYIAKRVIFEKNNVIYIDYTLNYEEINSYIGNNIYYPKKNPERILSDNKYLELFFEDPELKVVDDQVSSPTYSKDLAYFSWELIKKGCESGIYHFTNDGIASKYEEAQYILEKISWKGNLIRAKREELGLLAERPKFSKLSCKKIKEKLGVSIPNWKDAIDRYFKENNK